MLRSLLAKQKTALDYFFANVDVQEWEQALSLLVGNRGRTIFTGIGKSGLVAQKTAATLASTGTPALFLCPANALHGDIGNVAAGDLCIALSKSGESQELLEIMPHLEKRGVQIIAVVSATGSRLERAAVCAVHLPLLQELCPFDLAPTTSTTLQAIFGDVLAVALMQSKGFSVEHFALNHPGGLLGRKITLRVSDLMVKESRIPLACASDVLMERLHELSSKQCGCLVVVDERKTLQGIFTDGDLRRSIQAHGAQILQKTLGELMTKTPKVTSADRLAMEALRSMEAGPPVTVLPVLDGQRVVGLVRMHDILQTHD